MPSQRYVRQQLVEAGTTFQDAVVQIKKLRRNPQTGGVTYEWILADPNIDDWDPPTEEGDPAPVGERVAPEPLETPAVASAVFIGSDSGQGTQGARVEIHATGPDRDDLTWRARWRSDGGNWSGDLVRYVAGNGNGREARSLRHRCREPVRPYPHRVQSGPKTDSGWHH